MSFVIVAGQIYRKASDDIISFEEVVDHFVDFYEVDEDEIYDGVADLYYEIANRFETEFDGADCWRAIKLPPQSDPSTLSPLGIYWAYEQEAAQPYGAGLDRESTTVVYKARIELEAVDEDATVLANSDPSTGSEEREVRFYEGKHIWVYGVTLEDGTVLEINDWRTT